MGATTSRPSKICSKLDDDNSNKLGATVWLIRRSGCPIIPRLRWPVIAFVVMQKSAYTKMGADFGSA